MKKDYETKRKEWLEKNGFSEDGYTYVIKGESYSIKDELKEHGFIFSPILLWHKATIDEEYSERQVRVALADVADIMAWGTGVFKETAAKYIKDLTAEAPVNPSLDWAAAPGETIKDIEVQIVKKSSFSGRFGLTNVITFVDDNNLKYTWFTTTTPAFMVGDRVKVTAKVKDNNEYQGEKITVLTRAKLKEI